MHTESASRGPRRGARILIVGSEAVFGRFIRDRLRQDDFSSELVSSSVRARVAYQRFRPDLVLVDLDRGQARACDLIYEIRSRGAAGSRFSASCTRR